MSCSPGRIAALCVASWAAAHGCTCGAEPVDAVRVSLRAAPKRLSFGALPVGATESLEVTLTSTGTAPYAPSESPRIAGADAASFSIVQPCPLPLNPGDSCDVVIAFSPREQRTHAAQLELALERGSFLVELDGSGTPAAVYLAPEELAFPEVAAGASAAEVVTVTNVGAADLDVALVISDEGFLVGGARITTVAVDAGEAVDVPIVFAPARGGDYQATLVAEVCGVGCGPTVALTGRAVAPRIDAAPRTVDLGVVQVGEEREATLTITNVGAGALGVTSAELSSPTVELFLDASLLPLALDEGASVDVLLRYAPNAPRAALDAAVRIFSSDPLSPLVSVPVAASTPGAAIEMLPSALHFGVLDAGDTVTAGVVVRAIGDAPVTLEGIDLVGSAFSVATQPPLSTLAPGDALLFDVVASAGAAEVAAGGAVGSVSARASGGVSASAALQFLSGTSGCQPRAPDGNEDLGAVRVGQGLRGVITIQNVGDASCELVSAAPAPGLPFDGGFDFSAARAVSIPPSGFGAVDVGFTALESGPRGAFLALDYQGTAAPLLVSAVGVGVLGDLEGEPPVLAFGPVAAGCAAAPRTATFVNRGSGSLTVASMALDDPAAPFSFTGAGTPYTLAPGAAMAVVVEPDLVDEVGIFEAALTATTTQNLSASVRLHLEVAEGDAPVSETFIVGEVTAVDVLFIVDDSGSMEDDQQILAQNFDRFIETAFDTAGLDFHLGVTTTDVLSGSAGRLVAPYLSNTSGGSLEDAFAEQALVGTDGSGLESGLEAMRNALEVHRFGADAGFLRDSAALSVVVVSDEEDSGQVLESIDPTLSRPAPSYVETLLAAKGGNVANTPILFSLVGAPGFMPRYELVAAAFSGVVLDIGADTWGEQLSLIGAATFGLQRRFMVAGTPSTGSVEVRVDGVEVSAYSVSGNVITLDEAPAAGSVVEVSYRVDCS